jgi:hypothetical protein
MDCQAEAETIPPEGHPPPGRDRAEGEEMNSTRWSPEEDERLRKLARSGFSLVEIANEIRRSKSSVSTRAAKLKIVMARDRRAQPRAVSASSG